MESKKPIKVSYTTYPRNESLQFVLHRPPPGPWFLTDVWLSPARTLSHPGGCRDFKRGESTENHEKCTGYCKIGTSPDTKTQNKRKSDIKPTNTRDISKKTCGAKARLEKNRAS